jgi:hypothetical protein
MSDSGFDVIDFHPVGQPSQGTVAVEGVGA